MKAAVEISFFNASAYLIAAPIIIPFVYFRVRETFILSTSW
jgi:hypothetical protein